MKRTLRKKILDARFNLSAAERRSKSGLIGQKLFQLPEFRVAQTVLFYASIQSEVETHTMIRQALAEGKRVVLPKVRGKDLVLIEIANFDRDVVPGAWGILEPESGNAAELKDIGIVVVPGAVFDERGNRIGYGAGYYDKLLEHYHGTTVALAFDCQIVPSVPADPHDIPIRKIVTESRVITAQ